MKEKIVLFLIFYTTAFLYAQDVNKRKGKVFFEAGLEYRITPFPQKNVTYSLTGLLTNVDKQNLGPGIHYGFKYFVLKKLSLGFSHSLRYAYLNDPNPEQVDEVFIRQEKVNYTLMMGYHFFLDYYIKAFNNSEIFARVGISMINRNSTVYNKEPILDQNGEVLGFFFSEVDYGFQPRNFAVGYKKNKTEVVLGVFITKVTPYFADTALMIPYIRLNYTLGKLF